MGNDKSTSGDDDGKNKIRDQYRGTGYFSHVIKSARDVKIFIKQTIINGKSEATDDGFTANLDSTKSTTSTKSTVSITINDGHRTLNIESEEFILFEPDLFKTETTTVLNYNVTQDAISQDVTKTTDFKPTEKLHSKCSGINVISSEEKETVVSLNNVNFSGGKKNTDVSLTLPELPGTIDLLNSVESIDEIFKQVCASKSCSVDQKKLFNENLQIFQQSVKWIDAVRSDAYGKPSNHNALYTEIEKYVSFLLGGNPEFRNLDSGSYNLSRCITEVPNHNQPQIKSNNFNNHNQPITHISSNEVSKDQEAYNSVLRHPELWEEYLLQRDAYQHFKIETAIERIRQISERLVGEAFPLDNAVIECCRLNLDSIASDVVSSATFSSSVSAFAAWLTVLDVGLQIPDSLSVVWKLLLPNPVEVRQNLDIWAAESGISLKQEYKKLRKEFYKGSTTTCTFNSDTN